MFAASDQFLHLKLCAFLPMGALSWYWNLFEQQITLTSFPGHIKLLMLSAVKKLKALQSPYDSVRCNV